MKVLVFLALLTTSVVCADIAELQSQLPSCSLECLAEGATDHGCQPTDIACQCSKTAAITKTVSPCLVRAGCDLEKITGTASIVAQMCELVAEAAASNGSNVADGAATETAAAADATETPDAAGHLEMASWLSIVGLVAVAANM